MRKSLVLSSVSALLVLGCNNPPVTPVDAGGDGGPVIADGGHDAGRDAAVIADGGTDAFVASDAGGDGGSDGGSDAAVVACTTATCSGTHACVRGTCVLTCGADTTTFDTQLATGLTVIGSVCHTPTAITVVGTHVYELATSTAGVVTTFTLTRWTRGTETPTVATVGTATFSGMTGDTTYPGGFVAVSSDEMHALFGYTTSPLTGSGHMAVGGVFDMATGAGTATQISAENNYDATFLDATHYVVNGAPSTGQGLYRTTVGGTTFTRAVTHLGEYSGSVELFGTSVLAGGTSFGTNWADGATGDRVLVLDAAAVGSATTTPVDGATVTQLVMPSSFELLSGGRAASTHFGTTAIDSIVVHTLTRGSSGTVTVASSPNLTTGGAFTSVAAAGTDIVLGFTGGLLFVH